MVDGCWLLVEKPCSQLQPGCLRISANIGDWVSGGNQEPGTPYVRQAEPEGSGLRGGSPVTRECFVHAFSRARARSEMGAVGRILSSTRISDLRYEHRGWS
jgi:hypothetical protein